MLCPNCPTFFFGDREAEVAELPDSAMPPDLGASAVQVRSWRALTIERIAFPSPAEVYSTR
jgi:hypothetical protein